MNKLAWTAAAALAVALGGCGGGGDSAGSADNKQDAEAPASLTPGEYEVSSEIVSLTSTDNSTPATKLKQGETAVVKACVAADGTPDPALFGEAGDKCKTMNSYARNGRLNIQLNCTREGIVGSVTPSFDGEFTADGFTGDAQGLTYFNAPGDYRYSAKVTAKRTGDCPAPGGGKAG